MARCYYLNTWATGLNPQVTAHIVNAHNRLIAPIIRIELKDTQIPQGCSIPIWIRKRRGKVLEAIALFNSRRWIITMEML